MGAEAVLALMDPEANKESSVIAICGNQMVRINLMDAVMRVSLL